MAEHDLPLPVDLSTALADLLGLALGQPTVEAMLADVVALAANVVEPAAACGITLRRAGHPYTVASSEPLAAEVDEVQYGAAEGPCLWALEHQEVVDVPDLEGDPRWPRYREGALAAGIRSTLSVPLVLDDGIVGALNLYGGVAQCFGDDERRAVAVFAAQAAGALALVLRQTAAGERERHLTAALASRTVIDQAIGIVMERHRESSDAALARLRTESQHSNRKLRDLAADMVTEVGGAPPKSPPPFVSERGMRQQGATG